MRRSSGYVRLDHLSAGFLSDFSIRASEFSPTRHIACFPEAVVKLLEGAKGFWPFKTYCLGVVVAFEDGQTVASEWRHIKEGLVNWKKSRGKSCDVLIITFEADAALWPEIKESFQRAGTTEEFISPFFAELGDVTLGLVTPDGEGYEEIDFAFSVQKAA